MNKIIIIGRITKDLELRSTSTGKHTVQFNIAVNEGTGDNQRTDFFEVNAWENNADFITKYFSKGRKILIEGCLKTSTYEKDGEKKTRIYILAQRVEFVDSKKEEKDELADFTNDIELVNDDDLPF